MTETVLNKNLDKSKFEIIGPDIANRDIIVRKNINYWQDAWRRLKKNPIAMISLVVLVFMIIMVIIGPFMSGHDPYEVSPQNKNQPISSEHWFGTDNLGRDLFTRVWLGARASVIVAITCAIVQIVIGCIYGAGMAYFGGWVDELLMRIIEVMTSIPSLLITLIVMMVLGNSMFALLIAMSITAWCGTARQMRGIILQLRTSEYVLAAETLGASPLRIIIKHLIPNTLSILILNLASSIPAFIFTEAGLSFIGMGLNPPDTSLGILISAGQQTMQFYPAQLLFPCGVLCLIVLSLNLLGDGLRDALDPKLRQ